MNNLESDEERESGRERERESTDERFASVRPMHSHVSFILASVSCASSWLTYSYERNGKGKRKSSLSSETEADEQIRNAAKERENLSLTCPPTVEALGIYPLKDFAEQFTTSSIPICDFSPFGFPKQSWKGKYAWAAEFVILQQASAKVSTPSSGVDFNHPL